MNKKYRIGDKVTHKKANDGVVYIITELRASGLVFKGYESLGGYDPKYFNKVKDPLKTQKTTKPSGGPSAYYDFPFKDWVTVNDMIEYLSEKQWGKHSWIFKDIVKACTRWGSKDGTTYVYDAKKIIYYGARLLMSVADKATLRAYLQELLDDKQFKENNND